MPIVLFITGALLVYLGILGKDRIAQAGALFEDDIMGNPGPGFLQWGIGVLGISAFFRLVGMPNAGRYFLILVVLAWVFKNQNVLTKLQSLSASGSSSGGGSGPHPAPGPGAAAAPQPGQQQSSADQQGGPTDNSTITAAGG